MTFPVKLGELKLVANQVATDGESRTGRPGPDASSRSNEEN